MSAVSDKILAEVQLELKLAGGDQPTTERAIERAARVFALTYNRAWSIWYGKVRRLWADEVEQIRSRSAALRARTITGLRAELNRLEAEDAADQACVAASENRCSNENSWSHRGQKK